MATPAEYAASLGVDEVLHFTTEKGVLGSLRSGTLDSRKRVQANGDLAYVFTGVWPRRDPEWVDHVSLSLTSINQSLYARAVKNLPDLWWAIMSFELGILDDDGVTFTSTNNAYEEVCQRGTGEQGLTLMFQDSVPWGHYGSVKCRRSGHPDNAPTDHQAEVLYPGSIDLDRLQRIYVREHDQRSLILAWCDVVNCSEPDVVVRPDLFD